MKKDEILKPIPIKDLGVLYPTEYSKWKRSYNLYKCGFCGNEFKAQVRYINSGAIISCGCYNKQLVKDRNTKHGLVNTGLYGTWRNIKNRTLNPKHKQYNDYGGRGITICDEWKNDFMSFYDWAMSNGYSDELSIDRIDNDGNYCPENCRWVSSNIQNRNKRIPKNNTSGYKGVHFYKKSGKYIAKLCVNRNSIYLGLYPTAVEAAIAYNNYIIENNLEGFILNEIEI